jgi:glycosyltransferase involved in cell wall biosynthesis
LREENERQKKGRILYLHAGSELYGADRILLELVSGMKEDGWEPIIILPNQGPLVQEFEAIGVKVIIMAFPVLRRKYFNPSGILSFFSQITKYTKEITKIIKEYNVSIVHSNTLAVLPGIFAAKKSNISHIWHVHEIITSPSFLTKMLSMLAYRYSDKVVTVSKAVKNHFVKGYPRTESKTVVIYNGINSNKFKPDQNIDRYEKLGLPPETKIFGMIGRINRWKGQLDLLSAAEEVLNKIPESHCLFVGGVFENETQFRDKLLQGIASKGLDNRITVLDFQKDPENVHRYFDVFILPSIEPDPLPTVVLESMSTGVPVVAYSHGGAPEMVKDNETGYLVEVKNTKIMAERIMTLLNNPELKNRMGKNGRERILNHFSKSAFFKNFSSMYEETIHEKNNKGSK